MRSFNKRLLLAAGGVCAAAAVIGVVWWSAVQDHRQVSAAEAASQACETISESDYDEVATATGFYDDPDLGTGDYVLVTNYRHSGGEFHEDFIVYEADGETVIYKAEIIVKDGIEYGRVSKSFDDVDEMTEWYILSTDRYPLVPLPCYGAAEVQSESEETSSSERHIQLETETRDLYGGGTETTTRELWVDAMGRPVRGLITVSQTTAANGDEASEPQIVQRAESTYSGFGETNLFTVPTVTPGTPPSIAPRPTPTVTPTPPAVTPLPCTDGVAVPNPADNPDLVRDCQVLLGAKELLLGEEDDLLEWSDEKAIDNWRGVRMAGTPKRVTEVHAAYKGLAGIIPPELGELTELIKLDLRGNWLTGTIPTELGELADLEYLNLSGNSLSGGIPTDLGNLVDLERLFLHKNGLTGTIPEELGNLTKVERFYLNDNQLTGDIPAELGSLSQLTHVYILANNQLTGCVPASWEDIAKSEDPADHGLSYCTTEQAQ